MDTDPVDAQRRLEQRIGRLIRDLGGSEVRRRIREADGDAGLKARLILFAFTGD